MHILFDSERFMLTFAVSLEISPSAASATLSTAVASSSASLVVSSITDLLSSSVTAREVVAL